MHLDLNLEADKEGGRRGEGGGEGGGGVRTRKSVFPVALADVVGKHGAYCAIKVGDREIDLDPALAVEGGLGLLDQFLGEGGREGGREKRVSGGRRKGGGDGPQWKDGWWEGGREGGREGVHCRGPPPGGGLDPCA